MNVKQRKNSGHNRFYTIKFCQGRLETIWKHRETTGRGDYKWCERLHIFIGKNRSHHL